jgi:hypothetical protein
MPLYSLDFPTTMPSQRSAARADNATYSLTGDMSFEFWYKQTAAGSKAGTVIASKAHTTGPGFSYKFTINADDAIGVRIVEDAVGISYHEREWTGLTGLDDGDWHHVAITLDISNAHATQFILYLDGSSQGNGSSVASFGTVTAMFDSNSDFRLGGLSTSGEELRSVKLFDVRLWNDLRTGAEISDNRLIRVSASELGLVSNWISGTKLQHRDIAINVLQDRHANANHLTFTAISANTIDYSPDWPSGYSAVGETDADAHEALIATGYTFTSACSLDVDAHEVALNSPAPEPDVPDATAPVVSNVSPTPGELDSDPRIARITPVSFDVTDTDPGLGLIMITIAYAGQENRYVVHDGTDFIYPFDSATSERTAITDGYSFTVLPRMGWSGSPTIYVHRIDAEGNIGTP